MALAYSAGIGERSEIAYDDTSPNFVASPLFCVTPEWQFVISARRDQLGLSPAESLRAVHAGQSTQFHSLLRPGVKIRVAGSIVSARQTRAGALLTTQITICDCENGRLISETLSEGMYRDVLLEGGDRTVAGFRGIPRTSIDFADVFETVVPLDRWFAHRYTECAAIWNPIHTELRSARAAGLPSTIVHGTALWALAGKAVADAYGDGDTRVLKTLSARFSAMVTAGTSIAIRHSRVPSDHTVVAFAVFNESGKAAITDGLARLRQV